MATTDYVHLQAEERGAVILRCAIGQWPPPEEVVLFSDEDRPIGLIDAKDLSAWVDYLGVEVASDLAITWFRRESFSQLTDEEAAENSFIARGGLYFVI